ncbi:PREDICTED: E3 ubiquitin-protein ligase TRIM11-like [Tinamus guttatus]|uniref:E3 ubiquitin-protein ligase TRIM11-like n=1 Tax=Tinamus guttatus TaxID=94827 RepID=UPI00052EBD83|nr:PREDICTED: E3 ubiquitin-protein ligase TRIM11-like [Tinamus guttatus]
MAESFRAEASCPICLGLFQDPVSIHCGHNFCRGCISRRWEGAGSPFSCPRCRETAPHGNLRPNRELAKVIAVAQRLSLRGNGHRQCGKHREALKLFCERERVPICLECRESPGHRDHAVVPIEEAAEEYKEKLQAHVQVLKDRREKLLGLKASEEGKSLDLLERVEAERRKVTSGIAELRQLLEDQERLLLERLAELDRDIVRKREENAERLSQEVASIGKDIAELEGKCQQPAWEFLQVGAWGPPLTKSIAGATSRVVMLTITIDEEEIPKPELGEKPLDCLGKNAALKETLLKFQVSVTLDPDTAGDAWAIGVAKESVRRKGRLSVNPGSGIWAVGQCGSRYQALAVPSVPIKLLAVPKAIGVYLDYEAGRVAFFDATNGAPMFAYPPAAFGGERMLPLLCLGRGCRFTLSP